MYVDEINGNRQYGIQHNRSTIDQIFCICQVLEKKITIHQLLTDFNKAYHSGERYCTTFSLS